MIADGQHGDRRLARRHEAPAVAERRPGGNGPHRRDARLDRHRRAEGVARERVGRRERRRGRGPGRTASSQAGGAPRIAGGVGGVHQARTEAGFAQARDGRAEDPDLPRRLRRRGVVRRGEVRKRPGERKPRGPLEDSDHPVELCRTDAGAAHACVDLEVRGERLAPGPGGRGEGFGLPGVVQRGSEAVGRDARQLLGLGARENQNLAANPRPAQRHALLDVGDREPVGPLPRQTRRDRSRTVPVGVGLHHRVDRPAVPRGRRGTGSSRRRHRGRRARERNTGRRDFRMSGSLDSRFSRVFFAPARKSAPGRDRAARTRRAGPAARPPDRRCSWRRSCGRRGRPAGSLPSARCAAWR